MVRSKPHVVVCERRQCIVAKLLASGDEELQQAKSGIAIKYKKLFANEFVHCKEVGTCSVKLCVFLLQWRSQLPFDTQEVEGMNNVLQEMTRRAGHLHLALASARMCLKKGPELCARTCVFFDPEVQKIMESQSYASKFLPVHAVGQPRVPASDAI